MSEATLQEFLYGVLNPLLLLGYPTLLQKVLAGGCLGPSDFLIYKRSCEGFLELARSAVKGDKALEDRLDEFNRNFNRIRFESCRNYRSPYRDAILSGVSRVPSLRSRRLHQSWNLSMEKICDSAAGASWNGRA